MDSFTIDCDQCVRNGTEHCDDCIVTFICNREPDDAIVLNLDELRTMNMLSKAGLVPGLRHEPVGRSAAP